MTLALKEPAVVLESRHKIDAKGALYCRCGKRLGVRLGFLTPLRSAAVVLYRECKYCQVLNTVFLDKLEEI